MALREDQIVRYGRQILLRELGGRGQERLLTSPVRVWGNGPAIDDAVAWLLAGGSPIQLAPGASLGGFLTGLPLQALNPEAASPGEPAVDLLAPGLSSTARTQVVLGAGVAYRNPEACEECWAVTRLTLGSEMPPPGPVGSLAALTVQRMVLGWSDALGIIRWRGDHFENGSIAPCPHEVKTP